MMGSMDLKIMIWLPVENNSCSSRISHEITVVWSIINILSCNTPIYDVDYNTPYFDLFVFWYWSIPYEWSNIVTQHILNSEVDPDEILIG